MRRVRGFDFTSAPGRHKPIICAECQLDEDRLVFQRLVRYAEADFSGFDAALRESGPWLAGLDFPFGLPEEFIAEIGWGRRWADYVAHAGALTCEEFARLLSEWKAPRPVGQKEPFRRCEAGTGAASALKLYGVPVGRMFHRGALRLLQSGADIPGLVAGDPDRVCIEAYPGMAARRMLRLAGHSRFTYKAENARRLPADLRDLMRTRRHDILAQITGPAAAEIYGLHISAPTSLADDETGDELDAFLAAVQAAWAWRQLAARADFLAGIPPEEGWIADPACFAC